MRRLSNTDSISLHELEAHSQGSVDNKQAQPAYSMSREDVKSRVNNHSTTRITYQTGYFNDQVVRVNAIAPDAIPKELTGWEVGEIPHQ